jgi:hypothetical protein
MGWHEKPNKTIWLKEMQIVFDCHATNMIQMVKAYHQTHGFNDNGVWTRDKH